MRDCHQQTNSLNLFDCGRCLLSMSVEDATLIEQSREYREFARMISYMQQARWTRLTKLYDSEQGGGINNNKDRCSLQLEQKGNETEKDGTSSCSSMNGVVVSHFAPLNQRKSFLQHEAADDLILKIFDFLGCVDLVRASITCSRLHTLVGRNAKGRTNQLARERQLENVLQLLRAQEQMEGIGTGPYDTFVPIPTLLLSRRIVVTNSGDPEYNGVYCCTGTNGNGFVFTKPRQPPTRVPLIDLLQPTSATNIPGITSGSDSSLLEAEVAQPGQLLRCIIAKRFSNDVSYDKCPT
jgi:hypothetical protein